jgi:type II secretory pathway component PulF
MGGEIFYNWRQAERNRTNFTKIIFMSRSSKLFIGILSFLPIVLAFVMFFMVLRLIPTFIEWSNNGDNYEPATQEVFSVFGPMFILGFGMGILSIGLLIFFIMHLVRHKAMDSTERIIWILVFLFAGIVGYPIYWYMRVWKNEI